jgi:hypothetical protein
MTFFVYFIVLLITVGSVIFGADWMQAPMSPMPASKYELHAAKPPPPPVQQVAKADTKSEAKVETQAEANKPAAKPAETAGAATPATAATPAPAAPDVAALPAPIVAEESSQVAAAEPPKCDIAACERAYRTFTASDCTYQPSGEVPRRLCTKGTPPAAASAARPEARAQATCNIAACSDAYISFNASDCTYQPSDGPRRLCTK